MGLADCLIKMGYVYGSDLSLQFIKSIYKILLVSALTESCDIAKEKGSFEGCDATKIIKSNIIQSLDLYKELKKDILKYGLYNSQLLTCAPTGSLSTMLGISGGIEPIFAMKYTRTTKSLEGKDTVFDVYTPIAKEYLQTHDSLSNVFVESKDIKPLDRIKVQSMVQKYTDASISSTINLDESASVEEVYDIYINAWKNNLKGVTIFRQGCARTAILNVEKKTENTQEPKKKVVFDSIVPVSRKQMGITTGCTFCKKCACGTLYITVNKDTDGNIVEVFTHTSKGGICQANLNAETRMASLALRSGVKVHEVVDQLKGISCPACTATKAKGKKIDGISCADIIAKTIEEFQSNNKKVKIEHSLSENDVKCFTSTNKYTKCPGCGEMTLIHEAGCVICGNCGYSKCE